MIASLNRTAAALCLFAGVGALVLSALRVLDRPVAAASADQTDTATDAGADDAEQPNEKKRPTRVIVHVSRNLTVSGYLEMRDDEVIVVRDRQDKVHSFAPTRVLAVTELVDPEPGQTGVVFLANGETREGVIVDDHFDYVLMEIEGVRAKISRPNVDHVVLEPTFEQRYAEYKKSLLPGQTRRHLALCRWLEENKAYDLARAELEELLANEENHEARKLLDLVNAQITLREGGFRTTEAERLQDERAAQDAASGPVYASDLYPKKLVTDEDVNIIRVYEIDFNDPPRVTIDPSTIREMIERYGTSELLPASQTERTALFRADPIELARLLFELRAREMYPQINVISEPAALNEFRLRVHDAWLINNCATSRCHGGLDAGRFFLHSRNYRSDRVRYTNLLILERLELDPQWPLVNYDDPMMSLIIQHALPPHAARMPHPDVPGWKPVFTRGNPRTLEASLAWIRSMFQPRPDYPVEYEPPKINQPAPKPAPNEQPQDPARSSR